MKNKKLFAILTLVCFMMTLMPVAAFATTAEGSYVLTASSGLSMTKGVAKDALEFDFDGTVTTNVYVWVESSTNIPSTALTIVEGATEVANTTGVFVMDATTAMSFQNGNAAALTISSTGTYTIHAAIDDADGAVAEILNKKSTTMTKSEKVAAIAEYELTSYSGYDTITVKATTSSSSNYVTDITTASGTSATDVANGSKVTGLVSVDANSVDKETVTVTFKTSASDNSVVKGKTVKVSTSSTAIEVSDTSLTTNVRGQVEFDVTGSVEGTYYVYVTLDSYEVRIAVVVGSYDAAYIDTIKTPSAPKDLYTTTLQDSVEFEITDINGNVITDKTNSGLENTIANTDGDYVKFTSKPSASDLDNEDLHLNYNETYGWFIDVDNGFDAEGTYTIKVILDNGKSTSFSVTIKEFETPVQLLLTYKQEAVELGGQAVINGITYVDANGVTKSATSEVTLAATGYAIDQFAAEATTYSGTNSNYYEDGDGVDLAKGTIVVKTDEKYVGTEINVIAVSERYNLTASATVKVTSDGAELSFEKTSLDVNVNNKITVQIVDEDGNKVAPTNISSTDITYVVLDKPTDANVSIYTASQSDLKTTGAFTMALTSDTIGNVAVQAVAKLTTNSGVVKYYTGSQIFAVGNGSTGDVVVMSIGSSEIIINDTKVTIDAAPIIQNDRTYVPFRALAEAFGATVAYDEATQAVTAELNGVTVVMTIGSATYTVNGVEQTMDVAPFINGSRTMVPVRFAAEAFGIKVIPTYDENGATADILFNL